MMTNSPLLVLRPAKCGLLSQEFEQHYQQEFERIPHGGQHMLEEEKQSVNIAKPMGCPSST